MTEQGSRHFEEQLRAAMLKVGDSPVVTPEQMVTFGVEMLKLMDAFLLPRSRQRRSERTVRSDSRSAEHKGDALYGCIAQLQRITGFSRPSIYEIIHKNREQIRTLRTDVSSGRARYNVADFLAVCEANGRNGK